MNFDELVKWFKNIGYKLDVIEDKHLDYKRFAISKNMGLVIGFCEPNDEKSYSYIDGKIAIDRNDCFDKWSKCPINLPFPENDRQLQFLLDKINWLKTEEGYKVSNEYDFDNWVRDYPND